MSREYTNKYLPTIFFLFLIIILLSQKMSHLIFQSKTDCFLQFPFPSFFCGNCFICDTHFFSKFNLRHPLFPTKFCYHTSSLLYSSDSFPRLSFRLDKEKGIHSFTFTCSSIPGLFHFHHFRPVRCRFPYHQKHCFHRPLNSESDPGSPAWTYPGFLLR